MEIINTLITLFKSGTDIGFVAFAVVSIQLSRNVVSLRHCFTEFILILLADEPQKSERAKEFRKLLQDHAEELEW